MLPAYDKAMTEFFQLKLNGDFVPLIGPVNPQRAFAKMQDVLKKSGQVITSAGIDDRNIPLPFMSFYRMAPVQNQSRFRRADLRYLDYTPDGNNILQSRMPHPYDILYQIDIWCEFQDDMNVLIESILRKWKDPLVHINVDHGQPFGDYKIAVFYEGGQDNSVVESMDAERILRYTLTVKVEGFLSFPARKVKTVRKEQIYATVADSYEETTIADETLLNEYSE